MEEVPLLKALHTKYGQDAAIIGISVDSNVAQVDRVVKEKEMTWPVLADGKGFDGPNVKAYNVQGTPDLFVLDRAGRIVTKLTSAKPLEATLQETLKK